MFNPSMLADAIVSTLQTNAELVAAMGNDPSRISAFRFAQGAQLETAIYEMVQPSILVYFDGTLGGNFSGYQIWKHKFCIAARAPNQANVESPIGYEDLWYFLSNGTVNGTALNIRSINIVSGIDLIDTPSATMMKDQQQQDYMLVHFTLPEIGDN